MAVRRVDPFSRRELRRFAALERGLIGGHPRYVSELDGDVRRYLSGRSVFTRGLESALFVATDGYGRDVARCAATVNPRFNDHHGERTGSIGWFAAASQKSEQVREMLGAAETWLAERGMERVIAPFNGSALLGLATLVAAYDEDPMFPLHWSPPYYPHELERAGYEPSYPFWQYWIDFSSEVYKERARLALANPAAKVRPIDLARWDEDLGLFVELFNAGFADEWQFHPYTLEEFQELYGPSKRIVDRDQILFAEVDGRPAGLCSGFPDWTPHFRRFEGKMGPRKVLRLMRTANKYDRAGLVLIAVLPEFRGKGVSQALAATLFRHYERRGLPGAFYYLVNDVNERSRRFAESFGGEGRISYVVYEKALA
jgi:GNAT superfamily N-acetyltransferase